LAAAGCTRTASEGLVPYDGLFATDYGSFTTRADLFRRIVLDEREHKEQSLAHMTAPRFGCRGA